MAEAVNCPWCDKENWNVDFGTHKCQSCRKRFTVSPDPDIVLIKLNDHSTSITFSEEFKALISEKLSVKGILKGLF
jgi:hypothetical protein